MAVHTLKTDPEPFEAVCLGQKLCEVRKNDRDYHVGDELWLKETKFSAKEMAAGADLEFTGRMKAVSVTHILHGPAYGIQEGFVVMSTRVL